MSLVSREEMTVYRESDMRVPQRFQGTEERNEREYSVVLWYLLLKFDRNFTSLLRFPIMAPLYSVSYAVSPVVSPRSVNLANGEESIHHTRSEVFGNVMYSACTERKGKSHVSFANPQTASRK